MASAGQLSKQARVAVQSDKNQSVVWDRVAATNSRSGVTIASGAFTANYVAAETLKKLGTDLEAVGKLRRQQDGRDLAGRFDGQAMPHKALVGDVLGQLSVGVGSVHDSLRAPGR